MIKITKKMNQFKGFKLIEGMIKNAHDRFKYLKIENNTIYCTDSKRALIWKEFNEGLEKEVENGFYILAKIESDFALIKNEEVSELADFERILPKDTTAIDLPETVEESAWIHSIFTAAGGQLLVNIDYLKPMFKVVGFGKSVLEYTNASFPIMITFEGMQYIVMPMSK